jgi:hypothetical protein
MPEFEEQTLLNITFAILVTYITVVLIQCAFILASLITRAFEEKRLSSDYNLEFGAFEFDRILDMTYQSTQTTQTDELEPGDIDTSATQSHLD